LMRVSLPRPPNLILLGRIWQTRVSSRDP
jgi:hypothetical protein